MRCVTGGHRPVASLPERRPDHASRLSLMAVDPLMDINEQCLALLMGDALQKDA
jgi:hypothetical protein